MSIRETIEKLNVPILDYFLPQAVSKEIKMNGITPMEEKISDRFLPFHMSFSKTYELHIGEDTIKQQMEKGTKLFLEKTNEDITSKIKELDCKAVYMPRDCVSCTRDSRELKTAKKILITNTIDLCFYLDEKYVGEYQLFIEWSRSKNTKK